MMFLTSHFTDARSNDERTQVVSQDYILSDQHDWNLNQGPEICSSFVDTLIPLLNPWHSKGNKDKPE